MTSYSVRALPLAVQEQMCCAPLAADVLSAAEAAVLSRRLKALSDPQRLRLLSIVLAGGDEATCQCDLTEPLGLSQPTVSHHLKVLVDAGLLEREQRGRWAFYRPVPSALDALAAVLRVPAASR